MNINEFFQNHSEVAVAFSGGVDSAVLLYLAKKYAKRVKAYYVKSQFQPAFELEDAKACSALLGAELEVISVDILIDKIIASNPENRCYFCKQKIFGEILKSARSDGFNTVLDGTNATDDASDRPGMKALEELKVLSPLRLCGYTKADIRNIAREQKLPVANKPSYACLATRIPTGTMITEDKLEKTELAESLLKDKGLNNFRVRYSDGFAKLELGKSDFKTFFENREEIYLILKKYYNNAFLDLRERPDND